MEFAFYSVSVWPVPCELLRCVYVDLSDDLRDVISSPEAEDPFVLTDHHMNLLLEHPSFLLFRIFDFYAVTRSLYPINKLQTKPSHVNSADTDFNTNRSILILIQSKQQSTLYPSELNHNYAPPESSIRANPDSSHFRGHTAAQRAFHGLYRDWFVACSDWYRILDSHASPSPFKRPSDRLKHYRWIHERWRSRTL